MGRAWACALLWVVFASGAVAQGGYRVGDRVEVDIIMSGAPERAIYRVGTIEKFEDGDVHVRLDDGDLRKIPLRSDKHWVRRAQGAAAPPPPNAPAAPATVAPPAGGYRVGDRVEIDVIMSSAPERAMYRPGTVIKIEGGEVHVRLDNGDTRDTPDRRERSWWIRPLDAPAAPVPPRAPAPPATPPPTRTTPRPSVPAPPAPTAPAPRPPAAPAPPAPGDTAQGAPPDGVYVCQKIGQTYMGLGNLDIRGNQYRGIGPDGGFHPFSVSGNGQITWSAGITGLPNGWTIRASFYAGLEHMGRPIIKIDYTSSSGWNDRIDCVRE